MRSSLQIPGCIIFRFWGNIWGIIVYILDMKSIYEYKDYRRYISDYYNEQKKFTGFSWRAFAKAAGFGSPIFLKLVCDGKNGLSKGAQRAVAKAMGLEGYDADYFYLLADYAHAKTPEQKQKALVKMPQALTCGYLA